MAAAIRAPNLNVVNFDIPPHLIMGYANPVLEQNYERQFSSLEQHEARARERVQSDDPKTRRGGERMLAYIPMSRDYVKAEKVLVSKDHQIFHVQQILQKQLQQAVDEGERNSIHAQIDSFKEQSKKIGAEVTVLRQKRINQLQELLASFVDINDNHPCVSAIGHEIADLSVEIDE